MLMLLLLACASGPTEEPLESKKPVLKLYLFAPDSPIVTRGEHGNVTSADDERRINTLDVWVFEAGTNELVSYIPLANLDFEGSREISMEITDEFALKASNINTKPNVDIYVVANATASNCGLTFSRETTPAQLEAALIEHKAEADGGDDFFGLKSPITSVPLDGLPMSGLLKNQSIDGSSPVFRATDNNGHLATVRLVRAVSRIRFIFSKSASSPDIRDLSVELNGGVLPTQEYLFLGEPYDYPNTLKQKHLPDNVAYESENATLISGVSGSEINACDDPASYAFVKESENGQQYENRIDQGLQEQTMGDVTKPAELTELNRFYLRESDRKLTGKIYYRIGDSQRKDAPFLMWDEGDFTRNHTWIVYGYFLGNGNLMLNVVDAKTWDDDNDKGEIYNW